jgi:hypothetical protein
VPQPQTQAAAKKWWKRRGWHSLIHCRLAVVDHARVEYPAVVCRPQGKMVNAIMVLLKLWKRCEHAIDSLEGSGAGTELDRQDRKELKSRSRDRFSVFFLRTSRLPLRDLKHTRRPTSSRVPSILACDPVTESFFVSPRTLAIAAPSAQSHFVESAVIPDILDNFSPYHV